MNRYIVPLFLAPALTAIAWLVNIAVQISTSAVTPTSFFLPIVMGSLAVAWWLRANEAGAGRWIVSLAVYVVAAAIEEIGVMSLVPSLDQASGCALNDCSWT